jgi:hypothetical protein
VCINVVNLDQSLRNVRVRSRERALTGGQYISFRHYYRVRRFLSLLFLPRLLTLVFLRCLYNEEKSNIDLSSIAATFAGFATGRSFARWEFGSLQVLDDSFDYLSARYA